MIRHARCSNTTGTRRLEARQTFDNLSRSGLVRIFRRIQQMAPGLGLAALVVMLAGCKGDLKPNAFPAIDDVFSNVSTLDGSVTATLIRADRPDANGGPVADIDGINVGINGGSLPITVSSATPFNRVVLAVDGLDNHFELVLPSNVTSVDLVASIRPQANPTDNMNLRYGLASATNLGDYGTHGVRIIRVATGDVQVSVVWDAPTDVDLRVTDPMGEEVYFGNLMSASGGFLDLDSNPACNIDGVNNENIVWPAGEAPNGTYKVSLDYWSSCLEPESNWVVTVQSTGQAPQIFSGTFTGPDGAGVDIDSLASFTR